MATRRWLGVDGDWNNTSNWSGGAVPVDNDDVYIDSGSTNITTNLNQSGINLNSLNVTSGYLGNIGAPGTSLQINVDGASPTIFCVSMGGGYFYWSGTSNVAVEVEQTGTGGFFVTGGTLAASTSLICGQTGKVTISSGVTVSGDTISCGCGIESSSALGSANYFLAGNHIVRANIGTLVLGGGATLQTIGTASSSPTITTATIHNRAVHTHNSAGTITTLNLYPGATHRIGGFRDYTVTTANLYAGSTYVDNVAGAVITTTTRNRFGVK